MLHDTLAMPRMDDILELDEMWSFVYKKKNKKWLWIALCRRTRQIVAFVIGDRSDNACTELWEQVPLNYKHCSTYSDFWESYKNVIQTGKHESVGKETGQTAHIERWNNTLRQRISRYVRKTLSFSKTDNMHYLVTKLFIVNYNIATQY